MGLNVQWPAELPDDLASIATALNHEAGHDIDRDALLDAWLSRLGQRYGSFDGASLLAEYRERCVTLGREVRAELANEAVTGVATDVDPDGHLLITTPDGPRTITAGDVVHLRPA
jgi:BirA family biotin operon repressor/biotin-[acetyl-CoA-carboxylase] ligase